MFASKSSKFLTWVRCKLSTNMNTWLIQRPGRLRAVVIALLVLGLCALSPLLLGVVMMALIEATTGANLNESNSIWGVLPWFSLFTISFFAPVIGILLLLSGFSIIRDIFVLMLYGSENTAASDHDDFDDEMINKSPDEDFNDFTL